MHATSRARLAGAAGSTLAAAGGGAGVGTDARALSYPQVASVWPACGRWWWRAVVRARLPGHPLPLCNDLSTNTPRSSPAPERSSRLQMLPGLRMQHHDHRQHHNR